MTNEKKMISVMYRAFCPESTELGEYQLGLISGERGESIRKHLAECPHCTKELEQLQNYLSSLSGDIELTLGERVKIWIARQVTGLAPDQLTPAPAYALRGNAEGQVTYQAGEAQLTFEIQHDPDTPGKKSLLGLILGIDPADMEAALWQTGEMVAKSSVDELGNFMLPQLDPGKYDIILSKMDVEIHIQDFEIK